jgi:hypothetical protein
MHECVLIPCGTCTAILELAGPRLRMILYADGVTPGSVLKADNNRKSVVWYVSFLEFTWRLSHEEVWLPIALART